MAAGNDKGCVAVLGTDYTIHKVRREQDPDLAESDGYCDKTVKKIVVVDLGKKDSDLGDVKAYMKKVLRHEIVHAFMFESGLAENWEHKDYGQEETVVDWFAIQGLKIYKAWTEAGAV